MTAQCPSCGCFQPENLLCSDDTAAYETMLAAVPSLLVELQTTIGKQAKIGTSGKSGKGTAREKNPIDWGVVAVRDALLVEVAMWGDDIAAVRRHPQAGEVVSRFGRAVKNAYSAIDRAADRRYLGTCLYEEGGAVCHAELWAREGAGHVKCSQCETVHDVANRKRLQQDKVDDVIATVREASQYIGWFSGQVVNQKTIRTWLDRGKLTDRSGGDGERTIRMGDLLNLLVSKTERVAS